MIDKPYWRAAYVYRNRGWRGVLPMPVGEDSKRYPPEGFTGKNGDFPSQEDVDLWRATRGYHNIAIRLPHGVVGIDVDAYEPKRGGQTIDHTRELLGDWTGPDETLPLVRSTSRTDGISGIYLFRAELPEGRKWRGKLGTDVEVVHFGHRYVMAAPSRHPSSSRKYRWLLPDGQPTQLPTPDQLPLLAAPWAQLISKPLFESDGEDTDRTQPKFTGDKTGTRYGVSALDREIEAIRSEWDGPGSQGFNNQLNDSAFAVGQLVAGGELDEDASKTALQELLVSLGVPQDQYKTLESGFSSGLGQPRTAPKVTTIKRPEPVVRVPDGDHKASSVLPSGGLIGRGSTLWLEKEETDPVTKTTVVSQIQWADFDLRATGRIVNDDDELQAYGVELTRDRDGATFDTILPAEVLSSPRALTKWLTGFEVIVYLVNAGALPWYGRLAAYLANQQAPVARVTSFLGWDDEAGSFLTFDGAITADGLHPFDEVRPDPQLRKRSVRYRYGFESTVEEAVGVLREVLTFHHPTVCSVFGAWWVACLLKGQIMRKASMFPAMAIEASSESGKTSGFFPMMVALAGNLRGQSNDTVAAFRDLVAGHRNGIAWQDDLDDPKRMFEMIRAATSEGTFGKKADDNTASTDARLVAPIMVSGEGMDITGQKALTDRVILLDVPSPKDRMSLYDPTRPQWDDIVALREKCPDLTDYAGHLVAAVLARASMVDGLSDLRDGQAGRHADKLAILRLGARVLADLTGDGHHIQTVDEWVSAQTDLGAENVLTLHLVPEYLRLVGAQEEPRRFDLPPCYAVPYPVLIRRDAHRDPAVWVNSDLLATWWSLHRRGRVDARTETASALRSQVNALGMRGIRSGVSGVDYLRLRIYDGKADAANRNERRTWQRLPDAISAKLLEEFEEWDPTTASDNVTPIDGKAQVDSDTAARIARATGRRHRR